MKTGFKGRLLASAIVVVSASYFNTVILPVVFRLIFFVVFLIATEFWLLTYLPKFIAGFRTFHGHKIIWQPMPPEYSDLAKKMGITVKKFGIAEDLNNAYTNTFEKKVVLGKKLMEKVESKHLLAIVAHEFGHIKGRHQIKTLLILLPFSFFAFPLHRLPLPMFWITIMVYFNVVLIPINWKMEHDADRLAAK